MKLATLTRMLFRRFVQNDDEAGLYLLRKFGAALLPGYRFSYNQFSWWRNEAFNRYLVRFGELDGMNTDRRFMVYELARMARAVPGDTAECGVFKGASSFLICLAQQETGKHHHIFDSFAGLSPPGSRDGNYWKSGSLACSLEEVQSNLRDFPNVHYYRGWIPDRFPSVVDCQFSFVHIDVDLEQPTYDSADFFWPRISPGGVLLCDDYGFTSCPGATLALDDYFASRPERVIALSGGGGFAIKGVQVGPRFEDLAPTIV